MSEYQYYEFQAVDRPLSVATRQELRAISSRARITATSFVNTYNFGDLKVDPLKLLERYFDLFCYVANWGTHQFAMRLPKRLVDMEALKRFHLDEELASVRSAGEHVIVSIHRNEIEYEEWDDGSGHLAALAPLRAELLGGDLQLFSLLWLAQLEYGDLIPDDAIEPAPGLTRLSGALAALADFLAVNPDLLEAAVGAEAPVSSGDPSRGEVDAFVRGLPEEDKVALLLRLHSGGDPHLGAELRRRCREARCLPPQIAGTRRTAGELRAAARRIEEERTRIAKEKAEAERRARQEKEAQAKAQRLAALTKRGEAAWREVEDLIAMRNASAYDQATALLADLSAIAAAGRTRDKFDGRIAELHARHGRKGQFIARLKSAGL
jgi:hypothetical protein